MREFQELSKSPGWERLVDYARKQVESRKVQLQAPPSGMDALIVKTYAEGEVAGIELFARIPEIVISDMTEQLDELKEVVNDG